MLQSNTALIQGPKSDPVGAYLQGVDGAEKLAAFSRANEARPLMGAALTGNADALKQLAGVDPTSFVQTQNAVNKQDDYQTKAAADHLDQISGLLNWADTPDKWQQAMSHLDEQGVPVDPHERDFNSRNILLAQTQTYSDQLKAQQQAASKVPQGYAMNPDGKSMAFVTGGPADPATVAALTGAKAKPASSGFDATAGLPQVQVDAQGRPNQESQQAVISSLNPSDARMVQGLSDYSINPKNISLKGNERERMILLAKQFDPNYDDTQFAARAQAQKDYAPGGKTALAMKSANNAIGHAYTLLGQIDSLNNTNSGMVNAANTAFGNNIYATDRTNKLKAAQSTVDALASESGKFFHGTGAVPEGEVQAWKNSLDLNSPPSAIKASVVNLITKLLPTGFESARSQYQSAFGKPIDAHFLSPQSTQILQKMGIDPSQVEPNTKGSASSGGKNTIQEKDLPDAMTAAQSAIKGGADPKMVIQRLIQSGVDPSYAGTLMNGQ